MDNQTLDLEVFMRSLSEEQLDACESDEKQLGEIFSAGWSEGTAVLFHRAMLNARSIEPGVTVEGVFETAFRLGLSFVGDRDVMARVFKGTGDGVLVCGIAARDNIKDRTVCSVSPDGAALEKLRHGKKPQKRGVRVVGVPGNRHGRAGVSIREA